MSYGKQFLGPISFFMDEKKNIGDQMDFAQRRNNDIGEEVRKLSQIVALTIFHCLDWKIRKVLELMEVHGGPKALQQIKFSIPLCKTILIYKNSPHFLILMWIDQSCVKRPDAHHLKS